jgi:hypothetical protein
LELRPIARRQQRLALLPTQFVAGLWPDGIGSAIGNDLAIGLPSPIARRVDIHGLARRRQPGSIVPGLVDQLHDVLAMLKTHVSSSSS